MTTKTYIKEAMKLIVDAKSGKISCDDALDGLCELLVNIDYEVSHRHPRARRVGEL